MINIKTKVLKFKLRNKNETLTHKSEITICKQCLHFIGISGGNVWYYQQCGKHKKPTKVDPVDGLTKYIHHDSFGNEYIDDQAYDYCRDINDGNCTEFTPIHPIQQ